MSENDDMNEIPSMIPDRDHVDTHHGNRRAKEQQIAPSSPYRGRVERASTWPVRVMLGLLTLAVAANGYLGWYFYSETYQTNQLQTDLRLGDLELQLNMTGQEAADEASSLREGIERTIEQYDLLWANWRANNQQFEDIQSEIARVLLLIEGQDEVSANNSRQIATVGEGVSEAQRRANEIDNDLRSLSDLVAEHDREMEALAGMEDDLESIRQALSSGDSTVLGLVGRLEYIEQSMESVNAHRLQINQSLFRLQEQFESLQTLITGQSSVSQ